MATAREEIQNFLDCSGITEDKSLDVSLLFAQCMLHEFRTVSAEWQLAVTTLQEKFAQREETRKVRLGLMR